MDNPERVIAAINALLSPFPAGVTQGPAEEVFRRYLEAVDEFTADDIDGALNEMLFDGGRLNLKLLGGAQGMSAG